MSETTAIQWCDSTINPVMGCDGCELWQRSGAPVIDDEAASTAKEPRRTCYAGQLHITRGRTNSGFAQDFLRPETFPGRTAKAARLAPLSGKERAAKPWLNGLPRLIFVSDMGDALSSEIPNEYLRNEIVEAATSDGGKRHIWLWLSKRPARMAKFSAWLVEQGMAWPPNVWAGTSVTSQQTVGRARALLTVGDANTIRFLSVEPQLSAIDLGDVLPKLNWVIQGGESGSRATPFDLAWARTMRDECRAAGVSYFLKQVGPDPYTEDKHGCRAPLTRDGKALRDRHGGTWTEWPEDLRVRQMPSFELEQEEPTINVLELMEQLCLLDGDDDAPAVGPPHETVKDEYEAPTPDATRPPSEKPQAPAEIEQQLEQVFHRLTGDLSELAHVKLLPRAKALYERLHPETRHGGPRQVAKVAAWPSFGLHLAERIGVSERTAYRRVEVGEALEKLDSEAEQLCYGTPLANQLGLLVRIAAIPKPELHRDLVNLFVRSSRKGREELCKWEEEFGLTKPANPQDQEQANAAGDGALTPVDDDADEADAAEKAASVTDGVHDDDDGTAGDDASVTDGGEHDGGEAVVASGDAHGNATTDPNLVAVMAVLGVSAAIDCVAAIQEHQTTGQQLRMLLQAAEGREAKLKSELAMYRSSQLGQLFDILGAKTAGQALAKARALRGGRDAA